MRIIIDSREQKPLTFEGHETIVRKLDEGDYNIEELEDKIVIERKSFDDLYQSIVQDHARFKKELIRAKEKGKTFYLMLEGNTVNFIDHCVKIRNIKASILKKILKSTIEHHNIIFIECKDRDEMSKKIVQLCTENNVK